MKHKHLIKVGDLVECIETISAKDGGPKRGDKFVVTIVESDGPVKGSKDRWIGFVLPSYRTEMYSAELVRSGKQTNWGSKCFKILARNSTAVKVLFKDNSK